MWTVPCYGCEIVLFSVVPLTDGLFLPDPFVKGIKLYTLWLLVSGSSAEHSTDIFLEILVTEQYHVFGVSIVHFAYLPMDTLHSEQDIFLGSYAVHSAHLSLEILHAEQYPVLRSFDVLSQKKKSKI